MKETMKKMTKVLCSMLAILLCAACLVLSPAAATDYWEMGGNTYATLQAAVDAAPVGSEENPTTVTLLETGYAWESVIQLKGRHIVVDGNNLDTEGTIQIRDTVTPTGLSKGTCVVKNMNFGATSLTSAQIGEAKMITFENCTFTNGYKIESTCGFVVDTSMTMNNCTLNFTNTSSTASAFWLRGGKDTTVCQSTVTLKNCTVNYAGKSAMFSTIKAGTVFNIIDSTLNCSNATSTLNMLYCSGNATINIGGSKTQVTCKKAATTALLMKSGTLTVDGGIYTSAGPVLQTQSAKAIVKAGTFSTTATGSAKTIFQADAVSEVQLSDGIVVNGGDRIYHAAGTAQITYPSHAVKPYTYLGNPITGSTQLKAYQLSKTVAEDGSFSIRLVGAVDSLAYSNIGFEITAVSDAFATGTATDACTIREVYDELTGITADDQKVSYTAKEIGGTYIFAVSINGLKVTSDPITFTVITYAVKDGEKIAQDPVTFTITPSEYYA